MNHWKCVKQAENFARKVRDVFPPKQLVNEEVWIRKHVELKEETICLRLKMSFKTNEQNNCGPQYDLSP